MCFNPNELAWLAGLFDGEGCVGFYRRSDARNRSGSAYYVVAAISMTHAPTIKRVCELTGTRLSYSKRYDNPKHRNCFAWKVYNAKARAFLEAILPYSITKAEEIRLALAADDLRSRSLNRSRKPGADRYAPGTEEELDGMVSKLKLVKRVEHDASFN